jgi:hypothetical protein
MSARLPGQRKLRVMSRQPNGQLLRRRAHQHMSRGKLNGCPPTKINQFAVRDSNENHNNTWDDFLVHLRVSTL